MPIQAPTRWRVSDLNRYVRSLLDSDYRLQEIEVEGEISNFRTPASGHAYFTLKDDTAAVSCVMWASQVSTLTFRPRDGDRVVVRGRVSLYETSGQYQLYCDRLTQAGLGDLYLRFEELKRRLAEEGLFDADRKQPAPALPKTIGVVTSASTAAFQDVLNVLSRRYPLAHVILSPAPVQGGEAAPQIVAALERLDKREDIDVILIVRGGGSIEDLWPFNEEIVARAVAACRHPVISGVGHEIDITLTDYAADLRAPTPSAAAEQATPVPVNLLHATVYRHREHLRGALAVSIEDQRYKLRGLRGMLDQRRVMRGIEGARQRVDLLAMRAHRAAAGQISLQRTHLEGLSRTLVSAGPNDTLARGFALVMRGDGTIVTGPDQAPPGTWLTVRLRGGDLSARVERPQSGED